MKLKSNEQGKCPFCNSTGTLNYDCAENEGDMLYYKWTCLACGHHGEEWYSLTFAGHNIEDEDGNNIEITDDMIEQDDDGCGFEQNDDVCGFDKEKELNRLHRGDEN